MEKFNINRKKMAYVIKSLKTCRNDYYRKFKKNQNRELLILNNSLDNNEDIELIDMLASDENNYENNYDYNYDSIEDITSDEKLLKALSKLTDRQKEILYYIYVKNLTAKDLSNLLNISRQAINKTHNLAISNIKKELKV